ncbi:MAG: hypothetical protein ACP5P1_01645 [Acidimicrobiales bacterium]
MSVVTNLARLRALPEVEVNMFYWGLDVIAVVILASLLAFAAYALGVGLLGIASGERFLRCPRCHRFGLTTDDQLHPCECPAALGANLLHAHAHGIHLRHH